MPSSIGGPLLVAVSACAAVLLLRRRRRGAAPLPEAMSPEPLEQRSAESSGQCAVQVLEEAPTFTICGWPSQTIGSGPSRTIHCVDAKGWLHQAAPFPRSWCVITSLPDICEVQPPMKHEAYEAWFSEVVALIVSRLHPQQVAIFYQTDGRRGAAGAWLSKSFFCHSGARTAGGACVWHRVVCAAAPGTPCTGRPGYVHLLCFSVAHRVRADHGGSIDVLDGRGHMSWARAMGSNACDAAVDYVCRAGLSDGKGELVVFDP